MGQIIYFETIFILPFLLFLLAIVRIATGYIAQNLVKNCLDIGNIRHLCKFLREIAVRLESDFLVIWSTGWLHDHDDII